MLKRSTTVCLTPFAADGRLQKDLKTIERGGMDPLSCYSGVKGFCPGHGRLLAVTRYSTCDWRPASLTISRHSPVTDILTEG